MRRIVLLLLAALGYALSTPAGASGPSDARGHVGLALMLRKLATVGTVLHATAHPDDENNGLLAMESHGQGLRVVLATATRGNGGQNEIGPELFEALGVLRTEELLAAHAYDGAEQMFGLSVDFGYSFSIEETFEKWGRDAAVGDFARLIRMTRPDVIVTMKPTGEGGGQHHQASAVLAAEAFRAAADERRFPDQLRDGLRPWQARKIYQVERYWFSREANEPPPGGPLVTVDPEVYDPLLGRTYTEIGSEARAMHKCQGFGQLLALPGSFPTTYRLVDTVIAGQATLHERSLMDGIDLTIPGLAGFAGDTPPAALRTALEGISARVAAAARGLRSSGPDAALPELGRGLRETRALRASLRGSGVSEAAAYEIGFRLADTERKFEAALGLAQGLRLEALADTGVVVPGQQVAVSIVLANRGSSAIGSRGVELSGFVDSAGRCAVDTVAPGGVASCKLDVTVPLDARITEPYWRREGEAGRYTLQPGAADLFGLPFAPTAFTAAFLVDLAGTPVTLSIPVVHRYQGNIFSGEKRMELQVVPPIALAVTPEIAVVSSTAPTPREIRVTVTNRRPQPDGARVWLEAPGGWTVTPPETSVAFSRANEASVLTFTVAPPARVAPGRLAIPAVAESEGQRFTRGYDVIEYPHTRRRHIYQPAAAAVQVIDLRVPDGLEVGYVMGVGDQVPPALEQLGATVTLLGPADLAGRDLRRFDAIVTGVRAYERRADLRAYNHRLLEYAQRGGTVLVQYNKFEFNQAQYAPWPAKVGSNRVTDEHAPVTVLQPAHPVFTWPNRIDGSAWEGWVQERGLYFLGERDSRYVDLVALRDPFPLNPSEQRGALVEARVGSGRWIYVGLGLWRQLPAGTPGAYQLLANLVSLGRSPDRP